MSLSRLFSLEPHGADVLVGEGHHYPWGGLYGGHIVAQALVAASSTIEEGFLPHSLRAYFIRRGDNTETVRYEVDRIRNGRSFATRRVVARQSTGAILNLEASFQLPEPTAEATTVRMPDVPGPSTAHEDMWSPYLERADVPESHLVQGERDGAGRFAAWFRTVEDFGDDEMLNRCALAYISDDLPTESVIRGVPELAAQRSVEGAYFSASLDHTIWFHRPMRAHEWHLYEMSCHAYISGRGLSLGYVFSREGEHVATIAQEVLVRLTADKR